MTDGSTLDFWDFTVRQLIGMVESKEISSRELVEGVLRKIEDLNPALNAFVAFDGSRAMEEAAQADEGIAHGRSGPLAGIPFAVKDMEDAAGFVTSFGSATHQNDPPSQRDSLLVRRLRGAGAIVVGKTACPEFGLKPQTDSPAFGITRNPWNLDRTPAGSSGGTVAALAAGIIPFATGSDGGGSIRIPAAVTGLSGFKPTLGRVPMGDPSAPGWNFLSTRGPMARRIGDVAFLLDLVVGSDPHDTRSLPDKTILWADAIASPRPPARVAWCPTLGYAQVDTEIREICEAALKLMADQGTEVVHLDSVFDVDPGPALGAMVSTYIHRLIEPLRDTPMWDRLDPLVVISGEIAKMNVSALDLVAAEDHCHRLSWELAELFEQFDLLLCPTVCGTTPPCLMPMSVAEVMALFGSLDMPTDIDPVFLQSLFEWLQSKEPFNLPLGTIDGSPTLEWTRLTQPFNMTRSPAGTVCAGLTSDGMPVGLQVVGPWLGDLEVLNAIALFEQVLEDLPHPPMINKG
jgi:aspartyl-tRNA(Asn)/glutamyl-tRNA(Gln) amidotransferase subunit A